MLIVGDWEGLWNVRDGYRGLERKWASLFIGGHAYCVIGRCPVMKHLCRRAISDHTEYMVPYSFICLSVMLVFQDPTPAVRPSWWTLLWSGEPCLSPSANLRTSSASWLALLSLASISFHEAGLGVNGFGYFCRNKRASAAGPNPGNTEKDDDMRVWRNNERPYEPTKAYQVQHLKRHSDTQDMAVRPEP